MYCLVVVFVHHCRRRNNITKRVVNFFFFFGVSSPESVQLVHDLGNVFEKVISPAVSEEAESILDDVLMFVRFYEQNEHFDLLTHGVGSGVVAVVMHNFSNFLGYLMGQKLVHRKKYGGKRLFPSMYMDKLRSIVNSIVVNRTDEYTGKMLKAPQETKPVTKTKKGKKTQGQDSKQQQQQDDETSDDDIEIVSEAESCLTNENDFTTLISGMGQAYHLPRNEVEEKLRVTQQKLLEQRMEGKARDFQDHLVQVIRDFRSVIMDCFSTPRTDECLVQARERLASETAAKSLMGFTFCVGDGFVEWVKKSLLAGQTLEQQYTCTKIDNSVDDPVSGHVTDIIYEVAMPVIIKHEVRESEDDDCEILSFQPAPHSFVLKMQIKEEKLDPNEKVDQKQDVPEDENPREHEPEEGGSGTEKAEGPENPDNEDMEEDTEIDIVNMTPKERKLKKKAHGAIGVAGPRRNLHSHDKTRQDKTV